MTEGEEKPQQRRRSRDIAMRAWEDRTQVVFILLIVQLISLVVAMFIITSFELFSPTSDITQLMLKSGMTLIAFIVGGTVTAGFILADRMSDRLREMVELVDKQIVVSELDIVQPTPNLPEVTYLAQTLDRLGIAYKESLDTLKQRVDELTAIRTIAESVNQTLNLQEIIDLTLAEVITLVGWESGCVHIWEDEPKNFTMVSFNGLDETLVHRLVFLDRDDPVIPQVSLDRVIVTQKHLHLDSGDAFALMMIPLVALENRILGLLTIIDRKQERLEPTEERLFMTLAHQMALAMDKGRLYAELNSYARSLESKVAERTAQLNEAISELWDLLQKAQEAEKLKTLLLSTVSHELRTPLMTIKGNISLLATRFEQMDQDQLKLIFEDVEDDTDKLTELITNLLEFSRLEGGMLQINPIGIDLALVIRAAVNAAKVRIKTHPIELVEPEKEMPVHADPRRLEQVIANLIDNAAKYSPAGSDIRVSITSDGEQVRVGVTDHGPGIKPEDRERIFQRFVQLNPRGDMTRQQGVGLGLAICHGLIEAHHGKIWAADGEDGTGASFYVSLPLSDISRQVEEGA